MARSVEQNRAARERARESILSSAIELFAERGVHGATIAEITGRAGVAQGLVNYHFGGKDQLVGEIVDRWFRLLIGFPEARAGTADDRLRGIIDSSLAAASGNLPLHRAVLTMQQDPAQLRFFAEAAARNAEDVAAAELAVRAIFVERGAADPLLEEVMLRTTLEGVVLKYAAAGGAFPLDAARGWVLGLYGLDAE
ncbi:AcrR family transcriptional regulator [Microbacterium sp. ZKA21]|uniref:TetR/AcrR family transcriptional regulator n=1 Tax=Microbacterium sp. ZKA21 TaxID=3381694 RepID=UPI003D20B884